MSIPTEKRAISDIPDVRMKDRNPGEWGRFTILVIVTAIVMIPVFVVFILGLRPRTLTPGYEFFAGNIAYVFQEANAYRWMTNSIVVALVTTAAAVVVAAFGGYVLSRAKSKWAAGYSVSLFIVQSVPIIASVIPLFFLFASLSLVDSIVGVNIIYVGTTVPVAVWMMGAYYDSIPKSLEEAAWIDGASRFGSFVRIVLRNSLPGVLSVGIFSFLQAWNDFLVALIFLRSTDNYTAAIGLLTFFQQNTVDWGAIMGLAIMMMAPPVLIFIFLNRYFSVGGIGGALAGR
ncbi:MAG: carbohydrate ABC transporter permease [Beutenbergiaceae bacterium]